MDEVRELVRLTPHPLDRAALLLFVKTGIGKGELCNLNLTDLALTDSDVCAEYDLSPPEWAPSNHAAIRIRRPDINVEYPGRRERVGETVVPVEPELTTALRRWLAIRPDSIAGDPLFMSTSNWGERVSPPAIGSSLARNAEQVELYEKGAGEMENLTTYTLRRFFAEHFPAPISRSGSTS